MASARSRRGRALEEGSDSADLLVATTTPALAPWFRRAGFLIVPAVVRLRATPAALLAEQARPSGSLQSDLQRLRRAGYRSEILPYSRALSVTFYERYLVPHALARFGEHAHLRTFEWCDRLFAAAGFALAVLLPGRDVPDVLALVVTSGDVPWLAWLGARDGDASVLRDGGLTALYELTIRFAHGRGFRLIDVGYGRPSRADSLVRYKWKWGFRPVVDAAQTLEYPIKIVRPDSPPARRLIERQMMVRSGRRLFVMSPGGMINV
jgi:hypothetical protein